MKKNVIPVDSIIRLDTMGYPIVSKEFETFDFETYEKRLYAQRLSNGIVNEMNDVGGGGFLQYIHYPDSYFFEWKIYYANGYIKEKGLQYIEGFRKGIWYEFDETGKLIRETDYDAPFKFTFEDIVKFCEKNEIRLAKGYQEPYRDFNERMVATILRKVFEGVSHWEIQYIKRVPKEPGESDLLTVEIILDGKTGKVLSKRIEPFFYQ